MGSRRLERDLLTEQTCLGNVTSIKTQRGGFEKLVGEQVEMWVDCLAEAETKAFPIPRTLRLLHRSVPTSYPSIIDRWSTKYIVSLSPASLSSKLI